MATPVRLYNVVQHVGGACAIPVGHPEETSVVASADDVPGAVFFWRMVDAAGASCAEGEFVGAVVIGAPAGCVRISVYAPLGSQGGTISIVG